VVRTCGRNRHRALGHLLAFNVRVVDEVLTEFGHRLGPTKGLRRNLQLPAEESHGLGQRADRDHVHALNDCCLTCIGRWHHDTLQPALLRGDRHRQRPLRRTHGTVQREFSHRRELVEQFRLQLATRHKQSERDRQIKRRGIFREIGWRQVDDDAVHRSHVTAVDECPLNTVSTLTYGRLRQPHQNRFGQRSR